jgi:hypothetical protein
MPTVAPVTIDRHIEGIYRSLAMLACMQLNVFTPLKDGPLTCAQAERHPPVLWPRPGDRSFPGGYPKVV